MSASSGEKRLDEFELCLSPKEWAIQLAQDMREHASETDFMKAVAKRPYREWPWIKPYFKLAQRAKECYPDKSAEDHAKLVRLNDKLRIEFRTLKKLIDRTNNTIKDQAETIQLKAALKLSLLQGLILGEAFGRTAKRACKWIKKNECNTDAEKRDLLYELSAYTKFSFAESEVRIEMLVDDLSMFALDILSHEIALQKIQEEYFDHHLILFRNIELKLIGAIKTTADAVETFNGYVTARTKTGITPKGSNKSGVTAEWKDHLTINLDALRNQAFGLVLVNEWTRHSREVATAAILQEKGTGEHEMYCSQILRQIEAH
jgi:hypothetical protein